MFQFEPGHWRTLSAASHIRDFSCSLISFLFFFLHFFNIVFYIVYCDYYFIKITDTLFYSLLSLYNTIINLFASYYI